MARPCFDTRPVCFKPSLRYYPGEDDDLIAYLDNAQKRGLSLAQAITTAMRGGMTAVSAHSTDDETELASALDDMFF